MEDKEYKIYVLLNDASKVKIGITTNFEQRLESLSRSNGGGNKIIDYYCSPITALYTMERVMHERFSKYRIQGTEWFDGLKFDIAVAELDRLFATDEYERCNELRKQMNKRR